MVERMSQRKGGGKDLEEIGEGGVAEGDVGLFGSSGSDDIAQGGEGLVDVLSLLQRLSSGTGFVDSLGPSEIDLTARRGE